MQGLTPAFERTERDAIIAFIEGRLFRGSRLMPVLDVQLGLTDEVTRSCGHLKRHNMLPCNRTPCTSVELECTIRMV